jgi:hypothetical protein
VKTTHPTVAEELQNAARAMRRSSPAEASFHRQVAVLLDQIALSAPLVEMHLPPITQRALDVARAYQDPCAPPAPKVLEIPLKPCGCGVLLGEVCDCAAFDEDAHDAFVSPLRVGWTR